MAWTVQACCSDRGIGAEKETAGGFRDDSYFVKVFTLVKYDCDGTEVDFCKAIKGRISFNSK